MTDPERERQVLALYERLLDVSERDRETWLANETVDDPALRARVNAMHEAARSHDLRTGSAVNALAPEDLPETIGAYRIIERLGAGGMGAVYLAERRSGDFEHRVAIKVIKSGLFSDTLIARFRQERQTLAGLNHPHIARLYDGGEMPDGAPYLVMEYVPGLTLNQWFEQKRPTESERLDLFLQVCDAVSFAHRSLIVHRDLTPSNILVTTDGHAKLIDFGIARPHVENGDERLEQSTFSGLSLTPGFAAPERIAGAEVNTLVDVYSLGKILDILMGDRPVPELAAIAKRAQQTDPGERYQTVAALAGAVEDWRENRPVEAFSTSRWYRFRKFFARERVVVLSVAAVAVALIAGLAATSWAYARAERERAEADQRFAQVRSLAGFQLFDLYDRLDNVVGNVSARVALAEQAQRYLAILADSADADSGLWLEAARGYIKLALIQGVSARPNLGEFDRARANLDRAQTLLEGIDDLPTATTAPYLAQVHAYRALILTHADSKPREARAEIDRCTAALAEVAPAARSQAFMLARSDCRLSELEWLDVEVEVEQLDRVARQFEREISEWPAQMQRLPRADFDRALATHFRATVGYSSDQIPARITGLERNLTADRMFAALERRFPNDPLVMYRRAYNAFYGHVAASQLERDDVAQAFLTQARSTVDRLLLIEPQDEALVTFEERLREAQADFYAVTGQFANAIAMQQSVVASRAALVAQERSSNRVSNLGFGHAILGVIARRAANRELACSSWREAERLFSEVAQRGDLRGHVAELRGGTQRNIDRCNRGEPVSSFGPLREQ